MLGYAQRICVFGDTTQWENDIKRVYGSGDRVMGLVSLRCFLSVRIIFYPATL